MNCLVDSIPTASWMKPLLIAGLVLVAIVIVVIALLYWYLHRKRLKERQRVNEESETWLQGSARRRTGQRKDKSREVQQNLEYSRLKYVGSVKDSGKTGDSEVMV